MATGYITFPTDLGTCAIAWRERGLVGVWLPESSVETLLRRLHRRHPDAIELTPPADVQQAIDGVRALLAGEEPYLSGIALDLSDVPAFHQQVYAVARAIPRGATLTYGEVAHRIGVPGSAQAVGQALGANPFPVIVPCHRVVAAGGGNGGFSAPGGVDTKLRMLAIEGATLF